MQPRKAFIAGNIEERLIWISSHSKAHINISLVCVYYLHFTKFFVSLKKPSGLSNSKKSDNDAKLAHSLPLDAVTKKISS